MPPAFAGSHIGHEDLYRLIIGQLKVDGHEPIAQMLMHATGLQSIPSQKLETLVQPLLASLAEKVPASFEEEKLDFEVDNSGCKETQLFRAVFFTKCKGPVYYAAFSPDGKFAATGSGDTCVKILDVDMMIAKRDSRDADNPCRLTLKEHKQAVTSVSFDPREPRIATGSRDGTVKIFDLSRLGRSGLRSIKTISDGNPVNAISYHPSGKYLLVGTDNPVIRIYEIATGNCFASSNELEYHSGEITDVEYSGDGRLYASCSTDGSIKLWDGQSSRCITTFPEAHGGHVVDSVKISRNFKYLLSSGRDKIKLWDIATGQVLVNYDGGCQSQHGLKCSFSHNERFVIGGNEKTNNVMIWDTRTGVPHHNFSGHTGPVRCIASCPAVQGFITGSEDEFARFWHY